MIRWAQTANYGYAPNPREVGVFMAVAMDLGNASSPYGSIHPPDKQDVGYRLALAGRAIAYGDQIYYSGPLASVVTTSQQETECEVVLSYETSAGSKGIELISQEGFEVICLTLFFSFFLHRLSVFPALFFLPGIFFYTFPNSPALHTLLTTLCYVFSSSSLSHLFCFSLLYCGVVCSVVVPSRVVTSPVVSSPGFVSSRLLSCLLLVSSRLVSCRFVSSRLLSCRLVSPLAVSYRFVSCLVVSSAGFVSSRVVSWFRVVSYRVVPSLVLSCRVASWFRVAWCRTCLLGFVSCRAVSYLVLSCRVVPSLVLFCAGFVSSPLLSFPQLSL